MLILIYSHLFHYLTLYFVFGVFSPCIYFLHSDFQLGWFCYYSGNYTFYFWALIRFFIDILLDFSCVFKLDKSKSVLSFEFLISYKVQPQKISDSATYLPGSQTRVVLFCFVLSCACDSWFMLRRYLYGNIWG